MTEKLITFHPDQPIDQVSMILVKNNISGGPVVDDDYQLVGVISEGDCLKDAVRGKYNNMPNPAGRVSDYMAQNVKTVHPEMNVLEAAKMFLNLKVRRFPVIRDGRLTAEQSASSPRQSRRCDPEATPSLPLPKLPRFAACH